MDTKELIAQSDSFIMATYKRAPVVLVRGEGVRVWDSNGKEYLDFLSGIAVCSLGHSHPKVVSAICRQAGILTHVSNLYYIEPQIRLAKLLVENSFADRVFFCNSGAEANEAAIKLARKYFSGKSGDKRFELVTMENSFHGRTMATISATGQLKHQVGFDPLLHGFRYVPFDDLNALQNAINEKTCGVLLEPIQGEGGIRVPAAGYLKGVRELCDRNGLLLIFDEVQVGMGRTGTLFAYQGSGVEPDIMTLAKALGNGFPLGAMLAREEIASAFVPGSHASTFGGNPLGMAAGVATMETILNDGVLENCRKTGAYLMARLGELKRKYGIIKDIRGKGLIIGMEIDGEGQPFVDRCLERGLLINCTAVNTLRFVPPLVVTEKEIDRGMEILDEVFANC